jgi:glycosyltransferase involved in cell wall biosynthesis
MNIVILAFNYWYAGKVVNGPGMCLANFVKFFQEVNSDAKITVFTQLQNQKDTCPGVYNINNTKELSKAIKYADLVHHWSGITLELTKAVIFANNLGKKVIIGPNLIDTVEFLRENDYLKKIKFYKILAVNDHLKFRIAKKHKIDSSRVSVFQVGPDLELWSPSAETDNTILWKGNSLQKVKNVEFALQIKKALEHKYQFKFIGYPKSYDYMQHIESAKKSKLLIITSYSETMGLAMTEGWQSGIPSISHPKIYLHGENYKTGIITNYDIDSYVSAIEEIMDDPVLYKNLSEGATNYMQENFSPNKIIKKYLEIVNQK